MSIQNRSTGLFGAWATAHEILGHADVHSHQNEATRPEPYRNVEQGMALDSHLGPPVVAQYQRLVPLRRRGASPRFGLAYPSQSPHPLRETSLPARPGASVFGEPPLRSLIGSQPSQSFTSPAPCFTNTPTHRLDTIADTQSSSSRSPFSSEPLPQHPPHRQNPSPHVSRSSGSVPQPYQPAMAADLSTTEQHSNLQPNRTPSAQPFLSGRATPVRARGLRQTNSFVANDPFRVSNNQTRPDDVDIIPSSYDNIPVENSHPLQGPWPTWQPNNYASPYLYLPNQQSPLQQQGRSSATPSSHQHGTYPPAAGQRPFFPSSQGHVPQHQTSNSRPFIPLHVFEPSTTPGASPDSWNENSTTPVDPPQSHSRSPSHPTSESFHWHYATKPTAPSILSRLLNFILQPFRGHGKLQGLLAIPWNIGKPGFIRSTIELMIKTIPRQVYLLLLLRLPSLYFSRVARIFEDADLTLEGIKEMALETTTEGISAPFASYMALGIATVPPAYQQLKATWEGFIDSVLREWKTFNIISVLLLSAILAILQIQSAADDPVTRYAALFSLICALISLLFGCMYIIRFGTMRKTYKAAEWALEAKRTETVIWWNVWVLLAMPAIWLTWSLILYIVCVMSFIWRTRPQQDSNPADLSEKGVLAMRIIITIVLGLGLVYGCLIFNTFQRYGSVMDKAWKRRIDEWLCEKTAASVHTNADGYSQYYGYGQSQPLQAYPNQAPPSERQRVHYG